MDISGYPNKRIFLKKMKKNSDRKIARAGEDHG